MPWFCLHRSPCTGKVIQRIVGQKNVQCQAFISKIRPKSRFKRDFGRLVRDPNATRARVNWRAFDYLPMLHFGPCPTSSGWGLTRQKQLSMTATAWVMWLCACQTVDWCLSMSLASIVWKELHLLSISVKCVPIPPPKKKQDDPPPKGELKIEWPTPYQGFKNW